MEVLRIDVFYQITILFGLGRYGGIIAQELRRRGLEVLGVDFDPDVIAMWHKQDMPARYGDAAVDMLIGFDKDNRRKGTLQRAPMVAGI